MDMFLGLFKPSLEGPQLWDMTHIITFGPNLTHDFESRIASIELYSKLYIRNLNIKYFFVYLQLVETCGKKF